MERTSGDGYDRVRAHSSRAANERIDMVTEATVAHASDDASFRARRLAEIEREWDIDRTIMVGFAAMGTAALLLGSVFRDRRWRFPLGAQIAFLLLHAAVGWCPPAVVLRRLGFRTRQEIETEHRALSLGSMQAILPSS
jgi:hypothetical protein